MSTDLIPSMKETLFGTTISNMEDSLIEIAEVGLDSVLEDGLLKEVPVFGTIAGICKAGINLRERNLIRQAAIFITSFNAGRLSKEQIVEYRLSLENDERKAEKELGRVVLLLDNHLEVERSKILGKFYHAYVAEKISWDLFVDITEINSMMFLGDYLELNSINQKPIKQDESIAEERAYRIQRLEALGLVTENRYRLLNGNKLACPETDARFVTTLLGSQFVKLMRYNAFSCVDSIFSKVVALTTSARKAMQKNILIGNGINIQFGGADRYSNSAILRRMLANIQAGKYRPLLPALPVKEHLEIFQQLQDVLINIENYRQNEIYLLKQVEIERIKRQYSHSTQIDEIGIEDYFLALEYGYKSDDSEGFIHQAHNELQMPFLDAIYNDGDINQIDYGKKFREYVQTFDKAFTLNYDSNLDRYFADVRHLHGEFSVIAPEYDANSDFSKSYPEKCKASIVMPEFKHVYSNAIMSWLWLEKYGEWSAKEQIYGSDEFQRMEGKLIILGMSPCNDEHIFWTINHSKVKSVDLYYYTDGEKVAMQKKIHKPTTIKKFKIFGNK